MDIPRKIINYIKDSIISLSEVFEKTNDEMDNNNVPITSIDSTIKWSENDETITIKKSEYESVQNELVNKTEIIKHLKKKDEEYKSLIEDYDDTFTLVLRRDINRSDISKNEFLKRKTNLIEKYENEISRLKSSEDRLKSHIQALKRDLIIAEEKAEEIEDQLNQEIVFLKNENEYQKNEIKQFKSRISELEFSRRELEVRLNKEIK